MESKKQLAQLFIGTALAAATLWDFRVHDVRLFDGVALAGLVAFFILCPEPFHGFLQRRRAFWLLFAIIALYAIIGLVLHQHRSSIAILVLAAAGFILAGRCDWLNSGRIFQWLLAIHIGFFLFQFVMFYGFGKVINYHAIIGIQNRIDAGVTHIRPAGLFQEPNSYCANLFVLGTIVVLRSSSWALILLAAATMILSESIWGIGAGAVLFVLDAIFRAQSPRRLIIRTAAFFIGTLLVLNAYLWITKEPYLRVPFLYVRILEGFNNASLQARYFGNCTSDKQPAMTYAWKAEKSLALVFGEGLSTQYFQECLPDNGIAFLFKSLGLVGFAALLGGLLLSLTGLPFGAKTYAVIALGFSFTTYPLATYMIFWVWLPAILGLLRLRHEKSLPQIA
jgi:hypothetical protein